MAWDFFLGVLAENTRHGGVSRPSSWVSSVSADMRFNMCLTVSGWVTQTHDRQLLAGGHEDSTRWGVCTHSEKGSAPVLGVSVRSQRGKTPDTVGCLSRPATAIAMEAGQAVVPPPQ